MNGNVYYLIVIGVGVCLVALIVLAALGVIQ